MTDFPALLDYQEFVWVLESDDLDELRELHDTLSDMLAKLDWHIRELEDRDARAAERELILYYQASVL